MEHIKIILQTITERSRLKSLTTINYKVVVINLESERVRPAVYNDVGSSTLTPQVIMYF